MTSRRSFLVAGVLAALAIREARVQARSAKIGILGPVPMARSVYAPGIVQRLAELGYSDVEYRSSNGQPELYAKQARELIALKCELIFALGAELPARALQDARAPMPIVFLAIDYDPLEKGIVASLRKPDRNTTGVYVPQGGLVTKRMEIMREVVPKARAVLVLADIFSRDQLGAARHAADSARFRLIEVEFASQPYDYRSAFERGRKDGVEAFVSLASPVFSRDRRIISELLMEHRLPGIGSTVGQAEQGFLLSFGTNVAKASRRTAEVGVRILQGARPSEIPVEQADEFELAINAATARALGVRIPESVMARATRMIP
jgi:putative tryptophan/tyrosine transport system substrate-binding protein